MCIIAVSRGTFCGGEALAKAVAERLGYRCISREELVEVAKAYGVPEAELTAALEKRPSLLERMAGEHLVYLKFVRAALCEQARGGKLVYHGHLGQLLLPGVSHVIAVRVIADQAFRLEMVRRQQNLTGKEAQAYIDRVDKERREWTRFLFGVDWDDPSFYHLVLKLGQMSLESACEIVTRLTGRPEFQPTETSLQALENLTLRSWAEVRSAMAFGPTYTAS